MQNNNMNRWNAAFFAKQTWRHRWIVLIPGVLLFAAATLYTSLQRDVYQSQTVLLAQMAQPSDGLIRQAVISTAQEMMRSAKERLNRFDLLRRVVDEEKLYPQVLAKKGMEGAVEELRDRLKIIVNPQSRSITISYKHSEGEHPADKAASVVNLLTKIFIEDQRNSVSLKAVGVRSFIEREEKKLRRELEDAEREIEDFKAANVGRLPEDRENNSAIIIQTQNTIERCIERKNQNRYEMERNAVDQFQLEEKLKAPVTEATDTHWMAKVYQDTIIRLERELADARIKFLDGATEITDLEKQIEEVRGRLNASIDTDTEHVDRIRSFYRWMLDRHNEREKAIKKDDARCDERIVKAEKRIEEIQGLISHSYRIETEYNALLRDVEDAKNRRKVLLARREEAAFATDFQDYDPTTPIEVEQAAFASNKPIGPKHLIISFAGLIAGCAVGLGFVFVKARFDRSFHSPDELRSLLPGTVLVTLPDIATVEKRAARAVGNVLSGLLVTGVFLGAVAVLGLRVGWWGDPELLHTLIAWIPETLSS